MIIATGGVVTLCVQSGTVFAATNVVVLGNLLICCEAVAAASAAEERAGEMKTVEEYLKHAQECEALMRNAATEEHRRSLQQMAETWRAMAEGRRKLLQSRDTGE